VGITIEYDSPAEEARALALRAGKVWCDLDGEHIDVWWSSTKNYQEGYGVRLKALGGKKINNGGGQLVLSLTNCRSLREEFGDTLEVGEALDDWAWDEIERLNSIDNFSSADSDAELSAAFRLEAPRIARVMHAYQRAGVAFCATTRRALLADQPGLGKTLQTIGCMVEAGVEGDILCASPTAARTITWPHEMKTWLPQDEIIVVEGTGKRRHEILAEALSRPRTTKRRWFMVNLEMCRASWVKPSKELRYPKNGPNSQRGEFPVKKWFPVDGWWDFQYPELFSLEWAGIVVDESHRCLITHTGTPQGMTLVRAGMHHLKLQRDGIKLALSGTPMRGKPENLWGTLNWLYPEEYSSYWDWVKRWFITLGEKSKVEIESLDEDKSKLFYEDIKPMMLRRTKAEVLKQLPPKLYAGTPLPDEFGHVDENSPVGHWIEMSPKQKKAYDDIQLQAETLLESGILVANGVLAELTRLKQFATCYGDLIEKPNKDGDIDYQFIPKLPSAKYDWLVEFLDDLGINKHSSMEPDEEDEVRKVVVASQFTSILDLYETELNKKGIETLKITGKVRDKDRAAAKERWQQDGGPRVFLLNTQAGGVSLTLDAADDLVFLDETWIPDDQEQVEDRIHRASRLHQVTIHYLRALGTVEEAIALTTGSRERTTKLLLDGERGVGFAKKLLTPIKRAA
jgi:SNF2 family DNA or RNA helicase